LLAKVISDVEATVEGMRKLTTEIFDTVVMFFFYIVFLFLYDVTMTLYALIPVFVAIVVAFLMRKPIYLPRWPPAKPMPISGQQHLRSLRQCVDLSDLWPR
jgi:ABC-type multidrug transport system fused ATPase/permease subunit